MKADVLGLDGKKVREINLPSCFNEAIRRDVIKKAYEVEKSEKRIAYGAYPNAGKDVSASGILKHARHQWKTLYGFGISRVPRKIMSRRGTRFNWVGAFTAGTRKGKAAHPPKSSKIWLKKMNKKERLMAIRAAISATANAEAVSKRYGSLYKIEKIKFPIVVESKLSDIKKSNEFEKALNNILQNYKEFDGIAFREDRKVRPGIGKTRGRKYKQSRGILIISEKDIPAARALKGRGIDVISVSKINLEQLAPSGVPGRLTIYTEEGIKEMEKINRLK